MKTSNLSQKNPPGWTVVRLFDYFYRLKIFDTEAREIIHTNFIPWCMENCKKGYWETNGVTRFSYKFQFENAEDAMCFKLVFGI